MSCRLVCGVIAPNDPDKLYEALVTATEKTEFTRHTYISNSIHECTDNLKIQILSLYVLTYSTEELKKLHGPFEKLSDRQIKKARHHAKINGPGVPLKKVIGHRVRRDMVKLDHAKNCTLLVLLTPYVNNINGYCNGKFRAISLHTFLGTAKNDRFRTNIRSMFILCNGA